MSSICGIINFNSDPVSPYSLRKMAEAAAYSGPDGVRFWADKNAGFAHLALHTTPEAPFEQQPLRDPQTGTIWVADARVDNRDELIDLFTKCGEIQGQSVVTDVELLMLAYRKWGEDFLPKIYGNYAFVMWDPNRQRALAGRDSLGLRPMFYMRHGQTMYFASVLRSILAVLPGTPALNELLIADYYRYNFDRWIAETIYQPIKRVPAACQVTVDARDENIHQHWMMTNDPILRYKNDQDYYDEFLELFQAAIKSCARTANPLGLQVSGGIDSSAIACTLHKMWTENQLGEYPPSVKMYYMHHTNDPSEDEIEYYRAVEKVCPQFSSTIIPGENFWGFQEIGSENNYHLDEPEIGVGRSYVIARLQKLRQDYCRVVLTGDGGDELFDVRFNCLDFFGDINFSLWPKTLKSFFRAKGFFGMVRLAAQHFSSKINLQLTWRRSQNNSSPWLKKRWKKALAANPPAYVVSNPKKTVNSLQHIRQKHIFTNSFSAVVRQNMHFCATESGLEIRMPYLDRRLLNFIFQLPTEKFLDFEFILKPFIKKALHDTLPLAVLKRRDKSIINSTIMIGIKEKERVKVKNLLTNVQKGQAHFINFLDYNSEWSNFLRQEPLIINRALLTPLILQAWKDSLNIKGEKHENPKNA